MTGAREDLRAVTDGGNGLAGRHESARDHKRRGLLAQLSGRLAAGQELLVARASGRCFATSRPATKTDPSLASSTPRIMLIVVVSPEHWGRRDR